MSMRKQYHIEFLYLKVVCKKVIIPLYVLTNVPQFASHLSKCLDISINKGRIISYVSFNALRLFGIIGIYKISHKNSETVYDHAIPPAGKITVSFAVWFILYSDFHGEKARKVCTIVTRGAYTSQSPMDLHRCTNSFGNRSGARIYAHTFIWWARIAICRSPMHDGFVRLFYMHRNWFAPDTGLAIEWRVSMRSPSPVPLDSSFAFVFFFL